MAYEVPTHVRGRGHAARSVRAGDGFFSQFHGGKARLQQIREGRDTFRYATFGDEAFWGDGIGLHLALAGQANGGVGTGVSPKAALAAGLKWMSMRFRARCCAIWRAAR
jgi:hypothetical protein